MKRYGWPRPPLIIGFVLGPLLERYLARSLSVYTPMELATRPTSLVIVAIALVIAFYSAKLARESRQAAHEMAATDVVDTGVAEDIVPSEPTERQ